MRDYAKQPQPVSRTIESNPKAANQASISEILQRYKKSIIQPAGFEDEDELLQREFSDNPIQQASIEKEEHLQPKSENKTGLPDDLKAGIENMSGYSMDDVKVYYNSDKPAQLNALAYAQGTDIHVGPGQENHLPHEVWHVVQQMQGRVQPTTQLQGVNINNNEELEKEADEFGEEVNFSIIQKKTKIKSPNKMNSTAQCVTNEDAKIYAQGMNLDYDKVVLPALNVYYSKKHVVKEALKSINDLSKEEYLFFISRLAQKGDYTGREFLTEGTWYRGIGFAHFAYKTFRNTEGIMCGEGPNDILAWSMMGSDTRWMPGATDPEICTCGPCGTAKYLSEYPNISGKENLTGIIVEKELSKDNPAYYQSDPQSECAIRGPQEVKLAYLVNDKAELIAYNEISNLPKIEELKLK